MSSEKYKYKPVPKGLDVVFAIVVKPPHWIDRTSQICEELPVGAITWFSISQVNFDKKGCPYFHGVKSVHPESNRYVQNFEPSCFELLITTNRQKVKK
jgi:hypothetical protein